ncbi:MAG TPA: hypothetical protein DDY91_20230 [Planctomycetaceae bacterium]|nr:hypothetical protein [Planctomycetaceae bacterium]
MAKRLKWLDEKFETTLIDDYARKLTSFLDAMADGHVDSSELKSQEARLVTLMKEVEPLLSDEQHEKVTRLLCELSAYNVMETLHGVQQMRGKHVWRP